MKKNSIISDKNINSLRIKKQIIRLFNKKKEMKSNVTIVIGGDGFMLQTLKKNKNSKKLFYGINSGNYGFLMNKFSSKDIIKNLSKSNLVTISPLEMVVKTRNNQIRKSIARKGKEKYMKYFNSNLVAQFIINKSFGINKKNKFLWSN